MLDNEVMAAMFKLRESVEEASGVVMVMVPKEIAEEWEKLGMITRGFLGVLEYEPPEDDAQQH